MMNATQKHDFATKFHITMPCLKVRCLRLPKPTLNFPQDGRHHNRPNAFFNLQISLHLFIY